MRYKYLIAISLCVLSACLLYQGGARALETGGQPSASEKENKDEEAGFFRTAWQYMRDSMGDLVGPGASSEKLPGPETFQTEMFSRLRSEQLKPERAVRVYKHGRVYIASSRKKLVAFDLSGERVLEHELSWAPVSTPLIKNERVYVGGSDGRFHCLELASGKEVWSRDLKLMDFSRPVAHGNAVIFQTGRDRVLALSLDKGEWLWEHQHLRPEDLTLKGLCPPSIKDGIVYIGLSAGAVVSMDAETGELLWKKLPFKKQKFRDVDAPLRVDDSEVYAVSVSGKTAALSRKTGRTHWKFERGGMAGSVLEGGTLYLTTDQAEVMAVDKMTGKKQWSTELSKRKKKKFFDLPTTPIIRGDFLVTVSRGGRVFMLDKRTGEIERHYFYYTDTGAPAIEVGDSGFLIMDNKGIIRYWKNQVDGRD